MFLVTVKLLTSKQVSIMLKLNNIIKSQKNESKQIIMGKR